MTNYFETPYDLLLFRKYLTQENRYVLNEKWQLFLNGIILTAEKRKKDIPIKSIFYRARNGFSKKELPDASIEFHAYGPEDFKPPDKSKAKAGRLNPEGIAYYYLAQDDMTAVAEIKPWIRDWTSLGRFIVLRNQRIVDTTVDNKRPSPTEDVNWHRNGYPEFNQHELENYNWGALNWLFGKPISPEESQLEYIATQYIAEAFKTNGWDGICYSSSFTRNFNYAFFDDSSLKLIESELIEITKVSYQYRSIGGPDYHAT
jgi:hypothetical protein